MPPPARVWFLNIGQGNATLATSGDLAILIDCPTNRSSVVQNLLDTEQAQLVHIFVTHRDLDHCGGVPALLEGTGASFIHLNFGWALPLESDQKVRVKAVLSSIFSIADRDNMTLTNEFQGGSGAMATITWEILAPSATVVGRASLDDSTNASSMVIRMTSGDCHVLVTGDADASTMQRIFDRSLDIRADVLLVPHHGARLSNLAELLRRVEPRIVVVSAGRTNAYGHPRIETLLEIANSKNVYLACTQVSRECHSGHLDAPACAGNIQVELVQPPVVQTEPDDHDGRISTLEWPICIRKRQRV